MFRYILMALACGLCMQSCDLFEGDVEGVTFSNPFEVTSNHLIQDNGLFDGKGRVYSFQGVGSTSLNGGGISPGDQGGFYGIGVGKPDFSSASTSGTGLFESFVGLDIDECFVGRFSPDGSTQWVEFPGLLFNEVEFAPVSGRVFAVGTNQNGEASLIAYNRDGAYRGNFHLENPGILTSFRAVEILADDLSEVRLLLTYSYSDSSTQSISSHMTELSYDPSNGDFVQVRDYPFTSQPQSLFIEMDVDPLGTRAVLKGLRSDMTAYVSIFDLSSFQETNFFNITASHQSQNISSILPVIAVTEDRIFTIIDDFTYAQIYNFPEDTVHFEVNCYSYLGSKQWSTRMESSRFTEGDYFKPTAVPFQIVLTDDRVIVGGESQAYLRAQYESAYQVGADSVTMWLKPSMATINVLDMNSGEIMDVHTFGPNPEGFFFRSGLIGMRKSGDEILCSGVARFKEPGSKDGFNGWVFTVKEDDL